MKTNIMKDSSTEIFRLNKYYNEFIFFLNTICSGKLIIVDDAANKFYLKFCKKIQDILDHPGFENLRKEYWKPFDTIRISDLDIEWEYGGSQISQKFLSLIEEYSIDITEPLDYLTKDDIDFLNYFRLFINKYKNHKFNYEENFELKLNKNLNKIKDLNNLEKNKAQKSIFIVHGKNEAMKQSVARLLENQELKPIILHEQPNLGNTIIEKFEKHSDVTAAIVLLSADDVMRPHEGKKIFRARQNVIFEMGFFIGKLGRKNVIAILQTDIIVEKPTDYDGVVYIEFDNHESWKMKVLKELKELKFNIDINKL